VKGRSALLGLLGTLVFLALALRNVDLARVGAELGAVDYRLLLPAALSTLTGYAMRTVRWQQILRPIQPIGLGLLFRVLMLGFATNNVLPARIGEVVRAYTLGRKVGVPVSLSLATLIVERVFDGLALLLLMTIALRWAPIGGESDQLQLVEIASTAIFLSALVVLIALLLLRQRAIALIERLSRPWPQRLAGRLRAFAESFIEGLNCLRQPAAVLRIAGLSLVVWSCEGVAYALVARAFNLNLDTGQMVGAVLFLVVFVNLGIMIPSAPGYIGTFQFFARLALMPFAVSAEQALGLAVVAHAIQYVLVTGIGLIVLWREQLSLSRLWRPSPSVDSTPQ
jgi:hypothetical protein